MPAKFKSPEQIFEEQEEKENQVDELIEGKKQEEGEQRNDGEQKKAGAGISGEVKSRELLT
ncbi:hypothetical protein LCGC14_2533970, partial [marine sediment metagenome]